MSVDLIFNIENNAFLNLLANNPYTVQGLKYSNRKRLNFTSNFLDQNNPISKYYCKNESIYITDFEAVQKTRSRVLSGLKTRGEAESL